MDTLVYGCGCSATHSMFGERLTLMVAPCMEHVQDPVIQEKLKELLSAMQEKLKL